MKIVSKRIISFLIFVLSLFFLFAFKTVPFSRLWSNYRVFYFDLAIDQELVENIFIKNQINYISVNTCQLPQNPKQVPMLIPFTVRNYTPEELREPFFYDKENKYQLFYIKDSDEVLATKILNNQKIQFGTDSDSKVFYIGTIFASFVLVSLLYFSFSKKNKRKITILLTNAEKLKLFVSKLPFLLLTFLIPFYSVGIGVIITFLLAFVLEIFVQRNYKVQKVLLSPIFVLLVVSILVCFIFSGVKVFFAFLLTLLCSISLVYFLFSIKKQSVYGFYMKPIFTINKINLLENNKTRFFIIPLVSVFGLALFYGFSTSFTFSNAKDNLFLPSPLHYNEEQSEVLDYEQIKELRPEQSLPDICDFLDELWLYESYPYRVLSLNYDTDVHFGDKLQYPSFTQNEDGFVTEEWKTVQTFDSKYINSKLVDFKNSFGVENLLANQADFSPIVYNQTGKTQSTFNMWIAVCSPLGILILIFALFLRKKVAQK